LGLDMDGVEYDVRGATGNAYIRLGVKVSWGSD
jgi:hypothetical protein